MILRWRPPYQTGKSVHVHAKHYNHNEDGRTAPGVCGNGSVPLSHSGNVVTRIDLFHIVFAHACICHVTCYFSIIGETLHRWGKRIVSHCHFLCNQ